MEIAGRQRVLVLVGILFTVTLAGIDNTVVSTVMPVAIGDLGGAELYAWAFAAYILATAVTMPIWGPGSDRWGRKRTFLLGLVVFLLGSGLCAIAPTMPLFIAARVVQGIGAGATSSLPFIILGVVFPPEKRGRALGIVSSAWAISSVAGPLLGTLIVSTTTWRWAFMINLPIGAIALFLVLRAMPESVGERRGRFDLAGSLLAGLGGSALIWAFVDLGEGHVGALQAALIALGAALLAVFVWHEARAERPILPLAFFRHRGYSMAMAVSFLSFFSAFGISAYLPLHATTVFADPKAVGIVVAAFTLGWSGSAFAAGRIVHRVGERAPAIFGLAAHAVGLVLLAFAFDAGVTAVAAAGFVAGLGMGVLSPGVTVAVQNSVQVHQMGSATTSQQFTRQLAAALGIGSMLLAATAGGLAWAAALGVAFTLAALLCALGMPARSLDAHAAAVPERSA